MTPATSFAGRTVALFGLGASGIATARALRAGGADVVCWDDGAGGREKAAAAGLHVGDLASADWSRFAALILSPGVPLTHPVPHWTVEKAKAAGVEIIGDIELFCRERAKLAPDAPSVAITGTNGKSTTTALVAHLFRAFGSDVQMGGNIGVPVLDLDPPACDRVHVLELSTFQIDLTPSLNPSVGVLLNLTPDHLDRHGTMAAYAAIKERLVASADHAIVATDDDFTRDVADRLRARGRMLTTVSAHANARVDVLVRDGRIVANGVEVADLNGITTLRGAHNAQNAAVAVATLCAADPHRDRATLQGALETFSGLPHRMEDVGRLDRVLFVNDSKATNADAAEKALASFANIFWILGGRSKEGGIAPLAPHFSRITRAYLIGESTDDFARTLTASDVSFDKCGTLDVAVARAAAEARRSRADMPVVLLSPACASYDQFPNYEVRGDRFRELVRALAMPTGAAA